MQPDSVAGVVAMGISPRPAGLAATDVPHPRSAAATLLYYIPRASTAAAPRATHGHLRANSSSVEGAKYLSDSSSRSRSYSRKEFEDFQHLNRKSQSANMMTKKCGFSIDDILQSSSLKPMAPASPPHPRTSPSPELPRKHRVARPVSREGAAAAAQQANMEFFARLQSKFYQDLKLSGLQVPALRASTNAEFVSLTDGLAHLYSPPSATGFYHPTALPATQQHHNHAATYNHHAPHLHPYHTPHPSLGVPIPVPVYLRGKTPAISPAEAARAAKKCRRSRTVFTELQLMGLEKRFEKQKYLSTPDRLELAETLGLSQLQVKTWYQNRRMKWKKQVMQSGRQDPPTKPKGRPKKNDITDEMHVAISQTGSSNSDHDAVSDMSDEEEIPVSDPHRHSSPLSTSSPSPLTSSLTYSSSMEFDSSAT